MSTLYDHLRSRGIKPAELASALGVNKGNVSHWNRYRVPVARLADVARVSGIAPEALRPDIFDPPERRG
jgi:pyruvate kinase